jgi:hypothetical protein
MGGSAVSYRCDICGIKIPHKQPRLVHRVFKTNSPDVAKELGCCEGCHLMLDTVPLKSVKDPYYLRPKKSERIYVSREAQPSPLAPQAINFGVDLEETFSRR